MGGWIAVWRDEERRYDIPEGCLLQWLDLKMGAAWQNTVTVGPRGEDVRLEVGQQLVSLRELAKKWGWSVDRVKRLFSKLETRSLISTLPTPAGTLLSITCLDDIREPSTHPSTQASTHPSTQASTHLHYREHNNHITKESGNFGDFDLGLDVGREAAHSNSGKIRPKSSALSEREKKLVRVGENTPAMRRLNLLFGRREDTLWTLYQAEGLERFGALSEEEYRALEAYYANPKAAEKEKRYLRSKLDQLINNLPDDIEKARDWCRRNKRGLQVVAAETDNDLSSFELDPESVSFG